MQSITPVGLMGSTGHNVHLLARVYRTLGAWQWTLSPGLDDDSIQGACFLSPLISARNFEFFLSYFFYSFFFFLLCRDSFIIQECHPLCNRMGKSMALMGFVQYSSDVTVYITRVTKCSLTVCCFCGHWIFSFNSLCSKC